MNLDLTDIEIDVLNKLFKNYMNSKNELSCHGNGVVNLLNMCKSLHNKGYIRITPLCLLEMSAEEWANSDIELHYETLDKAKPLFDEYQKKYTP